MRNAKKSHYEPLPVAQWGDYRDHSVCKHSPAHPTQAVLVDHVWVPKCSMSDAMWNRLVNIPSSQVVATFKDKVIFETFDKDKKVFEQVLAGKKKFDERTFNDMYTELTDYFDRQKRPLSSLHLTFSHKDVRYIVNLIGKHYFGNARSPSRWIRSRGKVLRPGILRGMDEPCGNCGDSGNNVINFNLKRAELEDVFPDPHHKMIKSVGKRKCTHPLECMLLVACHEFVHLLKNVFLTPAQLKADDDVDDGHGPVFMKLNKNLFLQHDRYVRRTHLDFYPS